MALFTRFRLDDANYLISHLGLRFELYRDSFTTCILTSSVFLRQYELDFNRTRLPGGFLASASARFRFIA